MIYSMTGFAVVSAEFDFGALTLELRAVNHRYLDVQFRLPDELRLLESALREAIATRLNRGKVECRIAFAARAQAGKQQLDPSLLQQLVEWNGAIRAALPEARPLGVADVLRWPSLMGGATVPAERLHAATLELLQQALQDFNAARAREGEKLKQFLLERVEQIEALRSTIAPRLPAAIIAYENKLRSRLLKTLGSADDERIRLEITLYASKIDVDEELSRLHSHLTEMRRILDTGGTIGKRLDFLMQELNREANTLGAKSVDAEVSRSAMEIKILIEQMREQIQNLE